MKFQSVLALSAAVVAFAGCAKDSPAGRAVDAITNNNAGKLSQDAELRAHKYVSKCDTTNLFWQLGGVLSSNIVYDFQNGDAGKTVQYFDNNTCDSKGLVGQGTYSGTQNIGQDAADGSRLLDLNYTKVVVTLSNQKLVDFLNSPGVPACSKTWTVGAGQDVTGDAGSVKCPISKPAQSFDIVETDGQTTFFGMKDLAHDSSTAEKRPLQLDKSNGYSKM